MSTRGKQASWLVIGLASAFLGWYLARYGSASYAQTTAPAPQAQVAPAPAQPAAGQPAPPAPAAPAPATTTKPAPAQSGAVGRPGEAGQSAESAKSAVPAVAAALPRRGRPASAQPAREPNPGPGVPPSQAPADAPCLTVSEPSFDFGTLYQLEKVTHDFAFKNTGKSPLTIKDVVSTCGCTVGKKPTEPIAPGGTGVIPVTFDAGRLRNRVTKHLYIVSNDPVNPRVTLTLTGQVKIEVDMIPTGLYFGRLSPGGQLERTVVLKPVEVKQFKIVEVKSSDPGITLATSVDQLKPAADGSYALVFRIGPFDTEKRISAQITIRTDLKHQAELPLPIYGRVANQPELYHGSTGTEPHAP